jgi:hypothetical protein
MTKAEVSTTKGNTPLDSADAEGANASIDAPRLTPQGRASPEPSGTDSTAPSGNGAAKGQPDKAEG